MNSRSEEPFDFLVVMSVYLFNHYKLDGLFYNAIKTIQGTHPPIGECEPYAGQLKKRLGP